MLIKTISAALLLLSGLSLQAGIVQVQFGTLPANTNDGTYNGFSGATLDGATQASIICDDFVHTTYFPSGPSAFNLSTLSDLSNTRFGTATIYEQAALLLLGDGSVELPGLINDPGDTSAYQYALWNLTEPGAAAAQGYSDPGAAALLSVVQGLDLTTASYQALYTRLQIYTPVSGGTDQEFLGIATNPETFTAAPEPGSWAMLVGGLAITVYMRRARRRRVLAS